jgi:hypothetical protein
LNGCCWLSWRSEWRWRGACRMESTSLVNRLGSERAAEILSACGTRAVMKVPSLLSECFR